MFFSFFKKKVNNIYNVYFLKNNLSIFFSFLSLASLKHKDQDTTLKRLATSPSSKRISSAKRSR